RQLVFSAKIDAEIYRVLIDFTPIGPDTANARDRSLANRKGSVAIIAVFGRRRPALGAVARGRRLLFETSRPDQAAGRAHRAIDARDRRPFLRLEQSLLGKPSAFPVIGSAKQRAIDRVTGDCARGRADCRA